MKKKNYESPSCNIHALDEGVLLLTLSDKGKKKDKEDGTTPKPPSLRIDDDKEINNPDDILWQPPEGFSVSPW